MGLLRGMARTAVVAGTATAVSNRVSRRQAGRWAEQDQAAYAQQQPYAQPEYVEQTPPPASSGDDMLEQLAKLGQLHDNGVLTDQEFEAQKAKILGS
jgi:Short C-terminal domain